MIPIIPLIFITPVLAPSPLSYHIIRNRWLKCTSLSLKVLIGEEQIAALFIMSFSFRVVEGGECFSLFRHCQELPLLVIASLLSPLSLRATVGSVAIPVVKRGCHCEPLRYVIASGARQSRWGNNILSNIVSPIYLN